MKQKIAPEVFSLLTQWAFRPDASTDLRNIFGGDSNRYQALLRSISSGDFSWVPDVQVLPAASMGSADGAYARETSNIYISSDCPKDKIGAVLLEEIGHHIDALFNEQETPGDEGSLFSAAVRGITLSDEEITAILNEDDSAILSLNGHQVAVECASKAAPPSRAPLKPIVTVKPGTNPGTNPLPSNNSDWETLNSGMATLSSGKHGLSLTGSQDLVGYGNSGSGGTNAGTNTLSAASNTGNTTLMAGTASTTMSGGSGNNWFDATQSQGTVSIQGGTGNSTMYAANGPATLVGGGKSNFLVAGTNPTRTLGQSLIGGKSTNSLHGNTLYGGTGQDTLRSGAGYSTLFSGSNPVVSTTIGANAALGVTSIRVASAAGLAVGQQITGNGIASGTTITAIAGTQLTLSAKTTAAIDAGTRINTNTAGNILIGQGISNSLVANSGNDSLVAVSGNSTLLGGTGRTTLQGGAAGSKNWLQSGSTGTSGNSLVGGAGSNTLVAGLGIDSIVGGANQNLLLVNQANLAAFAKDTISLSTLSSASNTLGISATSPVTINDSLLGTMAAAGAKNLGTAANLGAASTRIILGSNAEKVGVRTLVSGTGSDTLSVAGYTTAPALLDASKSVARASLVGGGTGNDTFLGSKGGYDTMIGASGNDSMVIQASALAGSSFGRINGNGGTDTLLLSAAASLSGTNFNGVSNIEVLQLGAGNNLVGSLQGSGIQRIVGNSGSDTLSANVYGIVRSVTQANSSAITLNVSSGTSSTMGFAIGQVVTGNGIAAGTTITNVSTTAAVGAKPATVTLTLSNKTSSLISQGGTITGWISGATLDGGTNTTGTSEVNAKGDYLVGYGINELLKGAVNSGTQLVNNTLVSGAFASNTLIGGSGANLYLINNLPGAAALPTIQNPTTLQSASTIQFTGNGVKLNDTALSSVSAKAAQKIVTANGNNLIAIGLNASQIGIQTIIGGVGSDTFVTGLQFGDPVSVTLSSVLDNTSIIVSDTTDLSVGSLVTGAGIADQTTILGIDTESGTVLLSKEIDQTQLTPDALLIATPLIPYTPSVYFDASKGSGNQSLASGSGNDTLLAGSGNATLIGGDGNNSLRGGSGNNLILSGVGNSTLEGGFGVSTLQADGGINRFIVRNRFTRILNPYTLERDPLTGVIAPPNSAPIAASPEIGIVDTYVNFDPIQGSPTQALTGPYQFSPTTPDGSTSITKSPSFASTDLSSFYNLQYFNLLGTANYGVGNALDNTISVAAANALILGMGGNNTLVASGAGSSLYGNITSNYSNPDLYAYAPIDTKTQEFVDGVIGVAGNNSLVANGANSFLDGGEGYNDGNFGSGSNTLIGNGGNSTLIQRHQADVLVSEGNIAGTVITSVDLYRLPDNVSDVLVVVTPQATNSGQITQEGQRMTAGYVAVNDATGGYTASIGAAFGTLLLDPLTNALRMQVYYGSADGTTYGADGTVPLSVSDVSADPKYPNKNAVTLSWNVPTPTNTNVTGYLVKYRCLDADGNPLSPWLTYISGSSVDLQGSPLNPRLLVDNLPNSVKDSTGTNLPVTSYDFQVTAQETVLPAVTDIDPASPTFGQLIARPVSLIGGTGSDDLSGTRANSSATYNDTREVIINSLFDKESVSTPGPWGLTPITTISYYPVYLDGGAGNDRLNGGIVNGRFSGPGVDFTANQNFQGVPTPVNFSGLNTLVGGTGADTFIVCNGGTSIQVVNGAVITGAYDYVYKYGNETPAGQSDLIVSLVPYLTLSDTDVSQGKFIKNASAPVGNQLIQGNRLNNTLAGYVGLNTLMGGGGQDFISVFGAGPDILIGGTAVGTDSIAGALADFANGLTSSIYRDTDPIPVGVNGPGSGDWSQYSIIQGNSGFVYNNLNNSDTLIGGVSSVLDGGAGNDSMVGGFITYVSSSNIFAPRGIFAAGPGNIAAGDVVDGLTGTVVYTASDFYWSGSFLNPGRVPLGCSIANNISNLTLQQGAPNARIGLGNGGSIGNQQGAPGPLSLGTETGSNTLTGNEFNNTLDGNGVGGAGGGVGVDTLIGHVPGFFADADTFVIGGYRNSSANRRALRDTTTNGFIATGTNGAQYQWATDGDYAIITDFSANDTLLLGGTANYVIGSAPGSDLTPGAFNLYNISGFNFDPVTGNPVLNDLTKNPPTFGIYSVNGISTPNLVAVVQTAGGFNLGNLGTVHSVAGLSVDGTSANLGGIQNTYLTTGNQNLADNYLGFGAMYDLATSDFASRVI